MNAHYLNEYSNHMMVILVSYCKPKKFPTYRIEHISVVSAKRTYIGTAPSSAQSHIRLIVHALLIDSMGEIQHNVVNKETCRDLRKNQSV